MRIKNKLIKFIATGGGLGFLPKAPGTWGTLGALACSVIILNFTNDPFTSYLHLILAISAYFLGVYATNKLIPIWGEDPSKIVIDEICGMWLALSFTAPSILHYIIAFGLFRFFDITKILGINKLDQIKSAHGVMLDDVLAGLYTGLVMYFLYFFDIIPV